MSRHLMWRVTLIDGEDEREDYYPTYYFEKPEDAEKVCAILNEWFELDPEGKVQYVCLPMYINDSADSILNKYSDITKKTYTVNFYANGFIDVDISQHTASHLFPMTLIEDTGTCTVYEVPYHEDKQDVIQEARIFAENHTLHKFDWNKFQKALTKKELNSWINLKNKLMRGMY